MNVKISQPINDPRKGKIVTIVSIVITVGFLLSGVIWFFSESKKLRDNYNSIDLYNNVVDFADDYIALEGMRDEGSISLTGMSYNSGEKQLTFSFISSKSLFILDFDVVFANTEAIENALCNDAFKYDQYGVNYAYRLSKYSLINADSITGNIFNDDIDYKTREKSCLVYASSSNESKTYISCSYLYAYGMFYSCPIHLLKDGENINYLNESEMFKISNQNNEKLYQMMDKIVSK